MASNESKAVTDSTEQQNFVGRSVERVEDDRILTGRSTYLDDLDFTNLLHAKIWRSPYAHAEIEGVDVDGALAMDGVVDAITGADLACVAGAYGHRRSGLKNPDRTALATNRVRFMGEGVAAVAAESTYRAGDALEQIQADLHPLEVAVDAETARSGEPIHPDLQADPDVDGNEWGFHSVTVGDVDDVFENAEHVISHTVRTNRPAAVPMEPHGCIADYDAGDGSLTLHTSTQEAHSVRSDLAAVLDLPKNKVRVKQPPNMGGGFGHKLALHDLEVVASVFSMRTERPVKIVLDRHEEFQATWARQPQQHDLELAVSSEGKFLAIRDDITAEAGGYTGLTKPGLVYASLILPTPYAIDHIAVTGRCLFTNTVPSSAYRGFGFTQATIAREALVDRAAAELGVDAWKLRRQNMIPDTACPVTHAMGMYIDSCGVTECLDRVESAIDTSLLEDVPDDHRRGVGVAAAMHVSSVQRPSYTSDNSAVTLRMEEDGTISLLSDQCPMGTGTATSLAQIVADELGIEYTNINSTFGDTDRTPFGLGSWGSRAMVIAGSAAHFAARSLREQLVEIAAHQLKVPTAAIEIGGGELYVADQPSKSLTLESVAYDAHYNGTKLPEGMTAGPLIVTESFDNPAPGPIDDSGRNDPAVNYPCGVHAVIVDIDERTGQVKLLDYAVADDVGRIINPMIVEGQIQGGTVQGIGMALGEELTYNDSGQLETGNLEDYRLPLITETPMLTKIEEADTVSERSPLGTKGVGESGTTIAPAAVLNAVNSTLSDPITELPIQPLTVFETIENEK